MADEYENMVNPSTGRDLKGRFAKGNACAPKIRKPSETTKDLRAYADFNNLTLMAVKRLEDIAKNKNGKYSETAQIRACETLLKHFNITVEKDIDKEIADEGNKTLAEMFNDLKGIK
ncbi:hypothetical protein ACV3J7_20805 [Salmonella enterica]